MNYFEYLEADGEGVLVPRLSPRRDGSHLYACPVCGTFSRAGAITNTAEIPGTEEDWACDGCWSSWQRRLVNMTNDADDPLVTSEWAYQFFGKSGSDVAHLKPIISIQLNKKKTEIDKAVESDIAVKGEQPAKGEQPIKSKNEVEQTALSTRIAKYAE